MIEEYPTLTHEDVLACLRFSSRLDEQSLQSRCQVEDLVTETLLEEATLPGRAGIVLSTQARPSPTPTAKWNFPGKVHYQVPNLVTRWENGRASQCGRVA